MNVREFFAGGLSGETYWQGVRRRIRQMLAISLALTASGAVTYAIYLASKSVLLTVSVAAVCGFVSGFSDISFIRAQSPPPSRSEKFFWIVWFAPLFVLLAGALVYVLSGGSASINQSSTDDVDLVGAVCIAWMLGSLTFATCEFLWWKRDAR
jgi:hypothetical protein